MLSVQEILRRLYVPSEGALRAEGSTATAVYTDLSAQQILNRCYDATNNELKLI
jgi:hypothetical protein